MVQVAPGVEGKNSSFLVSSQSAIDEHLKYLQRVKLDWANSFPGEAASHQAKINWLNDIESKHRGDPNSNKLLDPNDVLKIILSGAITHPVLVHLVARDEVLQSLGVTSLGPSNVYGNESIKSNGKVSDGKKVTSVEEVKNSVDSLVVEKLPDVQSSTPVVENPPQPQPPPPTTAAAIVAAAGGEEEMRIDEPPALVIEKPSAADSMQDVVAEAGKPADSIFVGNTVKDSTDNKPEAMEISSSIADIVMKENTADVKPPPQMSENTTMSEIEKVLEGAAPSEPAHPSIEEKKTVEETKPSEQAIPEEKKEEEIVPQNDKVGDTKAEEKKQPEPSSDEKKDQPSIEKEKVEGPAIDVKDSAKSEDAKKDEQLNPKPEKIDDTQPGNTKKPSFSIIARKIVDKKSRTDVIIPELLRSVGLPIDAEVRCVPVCDGTDAAYNSETKEFFDEMVSVPSPSGGCIIALEVVSKESKISSFERSLRERAMTQNEKMQSFMLVQKDAAVANGAEPTAETHHVLWFSQRLENERCLNHMRNGLGETDQVRRRLRKGGLDAANLTLEIVQAELNHVKRIVGENKWMSKLSVLLGLTVAIHRAPDFISSCEKSEDAVKTIIEISEYWRNSLLRRGGHTDVELGITPPGETDGTESRNALHLLLKKIQSKLESIVFEQKGEGCSLKVFFSCVPGKPRVRSPTAGSSPQPAEGNTGAPNTTPAPRGRVPHDSAGLPMTWDGVNALWRSSTNQNETRVPKKTLKPTAPAAAVTIAPGNEQAKSISTPVAVPLVTDGKQETGNSQQQQQPVTVNDLPSGSTQVNTVTSAAPIVRQPQAGKPRPGGRPPHDKSGKSMLWDSHVGVWRSSANPNETKIPGTPKKQLQTAQASPTPAAAAPALIQPVQLDVSSGNVKEASPTVNDDNIPPKPMENSVVSMVPFSIDPHSFTRSQQKSQTPRKRPAPDSSSDPSSMFTPPPRGRAPLDSQGHSMTWDGTMGLWRSNSNASETKMSKAIQNRRTSMTSHEEERTPKAPRAEPAETAFMEIAPAIAPAEPVVANRTESNITPASSANQTEQTFPRPGGRPPNDSTGQSMEWDFSFGIWRSVHVEGETKQPKSTPKTTPRPVKSSNVIAQADQESAKEEASTEAKNEEENVEMNVVKEEDKIMTDERKDDSETPKATLTTRPGGRAPNDSTGTSMVWDGVQAVWRSLRVPEETRKPNVQVWKYSGGTTVDAENRPVEVTEQLEEENNAGMETPQKGVVKTGDEENRTTPRPRGKPPNDSVGQIMQWDGVNGIWISSHVEGETRPAKSKATPTVTPKAKVEAEEEEESEEQAQANTPSMRPKGRAPKDSTGKPMEWDHDHQCWRSTTNEEETKMAAGFNSKGVTRPKGRAPFDSKGESMQWDGDVGVWRSITDRNESKTPKKMSG